MNQSKMKKKSKKKFSSEDSYLGKWRIQKMEQWDRDFIDLVTQGHFTFWDKGRGRFQFGAVEGYIDYRIESVGDSERMEFSWEGNDEMDPVNGRGWAMIKGEELHGRLYFHLGDDSWFVCRRNEVDPWE